MNKITAALKLQSFKYLVIRFERSGNKNLLNGTKNIQKKK